jgi:hypothetical protein
MHSSITEQNRAFYLPVSRTLLILSLAVTPVSFAETVEKAREQVERDLTDFEEDAWSGRTPPNDERRFIEINEAGQKAYKGGSETSQTRARRAAALKNWGQKGFKNWVAVLSHMPDDGGDGFIALHMTLDRDITLKTAMNIDPKSELHRKAYTLPYGTTVQISGVFVMDLQEKDYFREMSKTEAGGLESPEWLIEITSFKALD